MKWLISLVFLTGCVSNDSLGTSYSTDTNITNLSRISIGMDQSQVYRIMKCPYKREFYEREDNHYEVWFYVTNPTVMGQSRMTHLNLTPLTFKNDHLEAIGYEYYNWLVKEPMKVVPPKPSATETPPQNKELEQILSQPPSASPSIPEEAPPPPLEEPSSTPEAPHTTMSSQPKSQTPPEEVPKPTPKKPIDMSEEDQERVEQADEQDFDFW